MIKRSLGILSLRLSTQIAAFGVVVLAVTVVFAIGVIAQLERAAAFRLAEARADEVARVLAAAPGATLPGVWRAGEGGPHAALSVGHHIVGAGRDRSHVVVRAGPDGAALIVAYDAAPHRDNVRRAAVVLATAGVFLAIAASVVAQWLGGAVLRLNPDVRRSIGRQISTVTRDVLGSKDGARAALADTYTEYVRLLYEPGEREREFVANVGHELRTPITLIRTSCELLVDAPELTPRQRQRLRGMMDAADHMGEIVRSFTILARQGDFGPVAVIETRALVQELVTINAPESHERDIRIEIDIPDDAKIRVNREALSIVLNNLIRNAIRYSRAGGRVCCYQAGAVVGVRDDGEGIAEADLENIFQPFYRSRRAAEKASFGTGLGLAIVRRICDHYGWAIRVGSREGEGTDFRIDLGHGA